MTPGETASSPSAVERLKEAAWQQAFASAENCVALFDASGAFVRASPGFARLLDRPSATLVGLSWREVTHPDDLPVEDRAHREVAEGTRSSYRALKRYQRPDGSIVWATVAAVVLRDPTGVPLGFLTHVTDMTDSVHLEDNLRRFEGLVQTSHDFIAIAGLDGRVEFVNRAGRRLIGMPDDFDVTTTTIADYLTPRGLEQSLSVEQPAVVAHGYWNGISTLRNWRDNTAIPVAIDSFLVVDERTGQPSALATIQRDITEQLQAQVHVDRLAAERGELLLALADREVAEQRRLAEALHDDPVQTIAAIDVRMQSITAAISAVPEPVRSRLEAICRQIRDDLSHTMTSLRDLMFDLDPPELTNGEVLSALRRVSARIFADQPARAEFLGEQTCGPDRITAALFRIGAEALANVFKHASARNVTIQLERADCSWELTVTDDGVGIPAQNGPGEGRGVTSMSRRAAALGGTLAIRARPEGGTTLQCSIPAAE